MLELGVLSSSLPKTILIRGQFSEIEQEDDNRKDTLHEGSISWVSPAGEGSTASELALKQ